MGQRAVCFSQEICVRLKISTAVRTHARTLCANRNRHTTSSSTFCRVSVQSQKASFPGLVPESSPTARQFFCDDTAALPWGEFFFSSFFRTSSARHSVRELEGSSRARLEPFPPHLSPRCCASSSLSASLPLPVRFACAWWRLRVQPRRACHLCGGAPWGQRVVAAVIAHREAAASSCALEGGRRAAARGDDRLARRKCS